MAKLTPPRNGIPLASVTVAGVDYAAEINPEWLRYLTFGLFDRAGGTSGPTTVEAAQEAGGNGGTEEARAMIVDLRSDVDQIVNHGRIAAIESVLATLTYIDVFATLSMVSELRERVTALADMDTFALLATIAELRERVAALTERVNTFDQAPSL